ncbi:hypothetical protein FACS1894152_0780 [Bacilli bacterium]|nr:hypothetical protein FACS1894152_0780 [Bacilli bacterium]
MEAITSNKTIDKYIHASIDDLKTKVESIKTKTNDTDATSLINQMKFAYTLSNLNQLKKQYLQLSEISNVAIYEQQKNNAINTINQIKSMPKQLSTSKNIHYFMVEGIEPKVLSKSLSEIINADKTHGYIALNNYRGKLQYIIIASPEFMSKTKFNANQIIQQINKIANGSGGGRNEFAQGGTTNIGAESSILDLIAKL